MSSTNPTDLPIHSQNASSNANTSTTSSQADRRASAATDSWKPNFTRTQSYKEEDYKRSVQLQKGMKEDGEKRGGFSEAGKTGQ